MSSPARNVLACFFRRRRDGLTLIEILLVLTLIVMASALAVPSLKTTMANQRLKKGAEAIRAAWTHARATAVKTGQTQVFLHLMNGTGFLTMPQVSPEDLIESDAQTLEQSLLASSYAGVGGTGIGTGSQLPDGVVFLGAEVAIDQRTASQMLLHDQGAPVAANTGSSQAQWGMPVFFFPDGTTSTARLVLANQKSSMLAVEMRGLTGVVRVNPVADAAQIAGMGTAR
jgi:prepilin-type N-terminal cleavage/methylation domain-containing protein